MPPPSDQCVVPTLAWLGSGYEGVTERCARVEDTASTAGTGDETAAAQHGKVVSDGPGRAREACREAGGVRGLVEGAQDMRARGSEEARERGIGIGRAVKPDRAASARGIADPDRARRVEYGHHARPDECGRDE